MGGEVEGGRLELEYEEVKLPIVEVAKTTLRGWCTTIMRSKLRACFRATTVEVLWKRRYVFN